MRACGKDSGEIVNIIMMIIKSLTETPTCGAGLQLVLARNIILIYRTSHELRSEFIYEKLGNPSVALGLDDPGVCRVSLRLYALVMLYLNAPKSVWKLSPITNVCGVNWTECFRKGAGTRLENGRTFLVLLGV